MKVAITGALGHIGSSLIRSLASVDVRELVLIDDLSTQRYCSLFDLSTGVPTRFVEDDICTAELEREFEGADLVIHLAALTDATNSHAYRDTLMRVNVEGTHRVARAAANTGAHIVFVSTTSVYGTQQARVDEFCAEADLNPQSPYAESKLIAERLLSDVAGETGLRYIILRLGTIFGRSPGMRFHTAINKFVWLACNQRPLTIWNTAMDQVRPYLHLNDAVRAILFASDFTASTPNGIYNVLTANASVRQILDILRPLVPALETTFVSSPIMNLLSFDVSPERFKSLGFRYEGTLEDGIGQTTRMLSALTSRTWSART